MKHIAIPTLLGALAVAAAAAPASAAPGDAPTPLACLELSNQELRDSRQVSRAQAKLKKAKSSGSKAKLKRQLTAARRKASATKGKLRKCVKDNVISLSTDTVPVGEGFIVTVSAPEPREGQHYRVVVYGGDPADDDLAFTCSLIERFDWVSPRGIVSAVPYGTPGWCPGTGSVVLMSVPDGAPERYVGSTVARKTIGFVA